MDYNHRREEDNELWEWKSEDYYLQKDSHTEIPPSLWDGNQTGHRSYMLDDTTPVKACGDLAYNVANTPKNTSKESSELHRGHSSQVKRRRMLQFNSHSSDSLCCNENNQDSLLCNENNQESLLCSETNQYAIGISKDNADLMEDISLDSIQWESGLYGGGSASSNGGFDESSEAWLSNCFNDDAMHLSSDDMNISALSDDQINISELCNITDEMERETVQVCPTPSPKIVYKGRKSFIRAPTNLTSSVAYPFALIKPCEVHGDVTLKDINRRILNPVPPKPKEPAPAYPTSAFSGKPVVVKTKIRTEGGKGSITIMRTKG